MRHGVAGYKLGRKTNHRKAMWRNMAIALFTHGQITTTLPKAKSVKPLVEKLITAAKKGDLAARRRVIKVLGDPLLVRHADDENVVRNRYGEVKSAPKVVKKLFDEIAPSFADRNGGYTRIIKLAKHRIGDGTDLVVLQMVGDDEKHSHTSKSSRRAAADHRTAFAAKLRKGGKSEAKTAPVEEKLVEAEASAEAPAESADQTKSE
jgi:large subunit ribosomal protein L17